MRNISNSEVTAFLRCRRQYVFAFVKKLEPKKQSAALSRGNLGHEAQQRYIEARIDGLSHEAALRRTEEVFTAYMRTTQDIENALHIKDIFTRYHAVHNGWPEYTLYEPEQKYDLKLTDDFNITIRYDAKMGHIPSGETQIWDWKFTYDFWQPIEHQLNSQMPKYISVMNANGIKVESGKLVELRTRKLGTEKRSDPKQNFKTTNYYPSNAKKVNMLRQHIATGLEIVEFRNLSEKDMEAKAIPVFDKYGACKFCSFAEPCASMTDGADISYMLSLDFQENSYDYNKSEEMRELL